MSRYMRRRGQVPDRPVVRIPADVWRPMPGDDAASFRARHKAWFASVDYGRGVELRTPDGTVFPSSAVEAIRHRRKWTTVDAPTEERNTG